MVKKFSLIILLLVIFNSTLHSDSVSGIVHKYGFYALGDNSSTLFYNPAGLFNISSRYDEFVVTTEKTFTYNDFSIGKYITRFNLFSSDYPSSINLGIGVNKNKKFIIGIGGTLIDFFKYGVNFKYINFSGEKYFDNDVGFMFKFKFFPSQRYRKPEFSLGFTIKNLRTTELTSLYYVPALYIRPTGDLKITTGINLDKDFNSSDYSAAIDVNFIGNFYIMAGIQKKRIPIGIKWELTELLRTEVLFISTEYDKTSRKFNDLVLSYRHRFTAFKLGSESTVRGRRRGSKLQEESEEDIESSIPPKVLQRQKKILEKAKFYFAQEKLKLAERKFREVIRINKNSPIADEARDWLTKIKNIKKNLR